MGDRLHDNPIEPSPEAIRQQLQAIVVSRPFATATRARRFLTYVVEQTLAGQADSIKELVVGIEVFDRPADFDPKIDTIVRVEAGKLRKRLEEYYAKEGAAASVRIEVPKGSYVPSFRLAALPAAPAVTHSTRQPFRGSRYWYAAGILVVVLAACGLWLSFRLRAPAAPATPSIAVLPFLNLSPDPANEYFADGLTEELTDGLCNAGGLRVAARTSAFSFKGKAVDVHEIAAKLHVAYLVEGSVRRQGEQLKVTAQLIRTDDGYHVWSGSFERKLSDVFAVQQELTSSLVKALQVKLTSGQSKRLKKTYTANQMAFDLYLQGKHLSTTFGPDDLQAAERAFRQSIAADPAYPLPYIGLAGVLLQENIFGKRPARELVSQALAALQHAVALDDEMAEAYVILGTLSARHQFDWAGAERHLRHALELNPSSAMAHYNLAQAVMAPQGRWQEALAESRQASELDPLSPMIAMSEPWLAMLEGRHAAAVDGFGRLAKANPFDLMALGGLSIALMGSGDFATALEKSKQLQRVVPSSQNLAQIGWLHARLGNPAEARKILQQLLVESSRGQFVTPNSFCMLNMGLGNADEVFRWAEIGREQQESFLIYVRVLGMWTPFRHDRRYPKLLAELGLADEQLLKNQIRTR